MKTEAMMRVNYNKASVQNKLYVRCISVIFVRLLNKKYMTSDRDKNQSDLFMATFLFEAVAPA